MSPCPPFIAPDYRVRMMPGGQPWRHIYGQSVAPSIVMAHTSDLRVYMTDPFPLSWTRTAGVFERAYSRLGFTPTQGPRFQFLHQGGGNYITEYGHFETRALCYSFGGLGSQFEPYETCPVDMNGKFPKWMRNTTRASAVALPARVAAKCSHRPPNSSYPTLKGFSHRVSFLDSPPVVTDDPFDEYAAPITQIGSEPFVQQWPTHAKAEDFRLMKYPFSSPREIPEVRAAFFGARGYGPLQHEVDDICEARAQVQPNRPVYIGNGDYFAYFKCTEAHLGPSVIDYSKWVDITDAVASYINDVNTIPGETYIGEGLIGGYVFARKQEITGTFSVLRTSGYQLAYMFASDLRYYPNMSSPRYYRNLGFHPDSINGTLTSYCNSTIFA